MKKLGIPRVMLSTDFIHAKLFILDDIVILGSHNLTSASIAGRLELSIAIKSNNLANALDSVFEELWHKQERRTRNSNLNTSGKTLSKGAV